MFRHDVYFQKLFISHGHVEYSNDNSYRVELIGKQEALYSSLKKYL